jgi:hypothetical protein
VRACAAAVLVVLAACAHERGLEQARLASPSPEVSSCARWFRALDEEIDRAGVRDREYPAVADFPYLRLDPFLAASRERAAKSAPAFAALAERLREHDVDSRRHEIANLPAESVEKWWGMRLDDSRSAALRRSVQCGELLRGELARPQMRAALLDRLVPAPLAALPACGQGAAPGVGARVRFSPPPAQLSRATVREWLLRGEGDPLGQPFLSARELAELAAAYAPSVELTVASDDDRFGALQWRSRGAARPDVDAADPAVYVRHSYARYEGQGLLQIVYTLWFPEDRVDWRVTLAPDGEPLAYDASGSAGHCHFGALTPRARLRDPRPGVASLPRLREGERPLIALAAASHALQARGVVRGADSLARYELRAYDELRSLPSPDGRQRPAADPAAFDAAPVAAQLVLDLAEARP